MPHTPIKILLVEDDPADQMAFRSMVDQEALSYHYKTARSVAEARLVIAQQPLDVIVLDHRLPDGTAFDLLDAVNGTPCIIATRAGSEDVAVQAMQRGAADYFIKDPDRNYLKILPLLIRRACSQKQTEQALQSSERRYRSLLEHLPVGVYRTTPDGHVVEANLAAARMFGFDSVAAFKEQNVKALYLDAADRDNHLERLAEVPVIPAIFPMRRRDGIVIWVRDYPRAVQDDDGTVVWYDGILIDVTLRKRAEEEIQQFDLALDHAMRGVSRLDTEGRFVRVKEQYAQMLGYTPDELLGQPWQVTVTEADHPLAFEACQTMLDTGQAEVECCALRKDGSVFYKHLLLVKTFDERGVHNGHYCLMRDITERKRAEAALRESEERYRTIVEHAPEAIVVLDVESGLFVDSNANAETLYGLPQQALYRTGPATLSPERQPGGRLSSEAAREEIMRAVQGEVRVFEWMHQNAQGQAFPCEVRLVRMPSTDRMLVRGSITNITARKQTAKALRESEERYRSLVENQPDLVCQFKPDGTLTYVNRAYAGYFGQTVEAMQGFNLFDLLPQKDQRALRDHFDAMGPDNLVAKIEHQVKRPDGEVRWQEWTDRAFVDAAGNVVEFQSIGRDVTERKQAEEALQESETRYRLLMEESPFGVQVFDPDGILMQVNKAWEAMWGARAEDVVGKYNALADPQLETLGLKSFVERVFTGEILDFQDIRFDPSQSGMPGRERWVRAHSYHIRDKNGHLRHVVLLNEDVTERKQADEALQASEERNRALLDGIPDMIFRLRADGTFLDYKAESVDELAVPPEAIIGSTLAEAQMPAALVDDLMRCVARALTTGEIQTYEYDLAVPIGVQSYEVRIVRSGADEAVCVVRNVTARKQDEKEREALIKELEARNVELERFTYTVSHDLKTPLVTIKGFLGLLEQDALKGNTEAVKRDVAFISKATDKMNRLLGELLELSRIGRLMNPPEAVSLTELAREAVDLITGSIAKHGVQVDIDPALPVLFGDRVRLLEVYQNLIDNAVKFMGNQPAPRVEVGMRHEGETPVFFVRDNGIGIAPRYHEKVFGLFERLDPRVEGTGIGLTLVKRIVEFHGGRVWIESEGEGRGSTLAFTLPQ